MEYSQLGKSELRISNVGFGCMSLKGSAGDNKLLVQTAIDAGINYFDTADLYDNGANEELIGDLLKSVRSEVVIASKVGNKMRSDGSGFDWCPSKAYILSSIDESLRRLNTNYIDLYQLHGGTLEDPLDEIIEAFEILVQQGKIRYYGLSSIRPNVIREYVSKSNIVSVMTQYSLLDRRPEEFTLNFLHENKVGVLARGTVAQGLLIDKPVKTYLDYTSKEVDLASKAIAEISINRTKVQSALQFTLHGPAVTSAIMGFRTVGQLNDSIGSNLNNSLSKTEIQILESAIKPQVYKEHR